MDPEKDDPKWLGPPRVVAIAEELGVHEHVVFRDRRDRSEIAAWAKVIARDVRAEAGEVARPDSVSSSAD